MTIVKLNGKVVERDSPEWIAYCKRTKGRFDEMCEARQAPGAKTDREFMRGVGTDQCRDNGIDPETFKFYKQRADDAGVSIANKRYIGSLANEPADPEAWVSDFGEVDKLAEKRDAAVYRHDELVTDHRKPAAEPEPYRVADDLVDREVSEAILADPSLAEANQPELREKLREAITPEGL